MNSKRVFIAVLNQGDTRIELSALLHELQYQGKYDVSISYPNEKPIANNRNKIVQEFLLQKDFDYLMMIDSDIIPPDNILNLIDFQKDIISPICFIYQQNVIAPLLLKRNPEGTFGVAGFKGYEGLVELDAVGTGCIILSRKVLEDVSAPFLDIFDEHGVRKYGLDISFCQKAKAKGYKVYCHLDYIAEHYVRMGLARIYQIANYSIR